MSDEEDQYHCNTCKRSFGGHRYYKAHLKYSSNIRCKLANDTNKHVALNPIVVLVQRNKRSYDKLDDLLKITFDTGKQARIAHDLEQLLNKYGESSNTIVDNDENASAPREEGGDTQSFDDGVQNMEQDTDYYESDTDNDEDDTEEDDVPCNTIFNDFTEYEAYARANYLDLTPELQAGIDLLHLIHKKRVPSSLYKTIYEWHLAHIKATKFVTKNFLIKTLEARYNMAKCQPIEK